MKKPLKVYTHYTYGPNCQFVHVLSNKQIKVSFETVQVEIFNFIMTETEPNEETVSNAPNGEGKNVNINRKHHRIRNLQ